MKKPPKAAATPLREQAASILRRARALPPGPYKNDLRQLGVGLLRLYKFGMRANVQIVDRASNN